MATLFQFPYRTVAEVSTRALVKNLATLRALSQKEIIPVVKADAYGHGMVPVAKALVARGSCHTLSVATLEEAIELRRRIPYAVSILVLSGFMPHQLEAFTKYRLTPVIHTLPHLKGLLNRKNLPEIHLKIDTGMHRLGLMPDEIDDALNTIDRMGVKLSGLATHFAESENLTSNFVDQQISLFTGIYERLKGRKVLHTDAKIHISNTGGILRRKLAFSVAVRPGLGLYGVSPNPNLPHSDDLIPALEWKARVIAMKTIAKGDSVGYGRTYRAKKKERIAIVAIGYADGYPRLLSNEGMVLLGGRRVPVRGRVSMDMIAVDCTGLTSTKEGSLVTLVGGEGRNRISAWDVANWARTIPYEIFCGISPRVPRVYLG